MDIFELRREEALVIGMRGRLDAVTSPLLREKFTGVIDGGERRVVLDFSGMDYVSSAGLRVLFEAVCRLRELGGAVSCHGVAGNVRKIFDLADLTSEMPTFPSLEEALRGLDGVGG